MSRTTASSRTLGYANIRVWDNRITCPITLVSVFNACTERLRTFIQEPGCDHEICKFRNHRPLLMAHNTFVSWVWVQPFAQMLFMGQSEETLDLGRRWVGATMARTNERVLPANPSLWSVTSRLAHRRLHYTASDWERTAAEALNNPLYGYGKRRSKDRLSRPSKLLKGHGRGTARYSRWSGQDIQRFHGVSL